jgi:hypothetical protein
MFPISRYPLARIASATRVARARPVLLESGRALAAIEWRMFLSANRSPPRIKVRGRLSPEHALTGRGPHDDRPDARLYKMHPLTTGTPAVVAAANKKSRRATKPSSLAPMIPVGLLRTARPDSDFSATLRRNFFAFAPKSSTAAPRIVKSRSSNRGIRASNIKAVRL